MDDDLEEEVENQRGSGWSWIGVLIVGILLGVFVFGSKKYEGENAEYWFNQYDEYFTLYSDSQDCLANISDISEYNSYGENYEDMQSAFDEITDIASSCQ